MNEADALDIVDAAMWAVLFGAGTAVAAAMLIGIAIALFQALTQVQEATLTFVPKIVVMAVVIAFSAPFVGAKMYVFSEFVFSRIESGFVH